MKPRSANSKELISAPRRPKALNMFHRMRNIEFSESTVKPYITFFVSKFILLLPAFRRTASEQVP